MFQPEQRLQRAFSKEGVAVRDGGTGMIEIIDIVSHELTFLIPPSRRVKARLNVESRKLMP